MAVSYDNAAINSDRVAQANFILHLTIDLDDSYPTGGYPLTALTDEFTPSYTVLNIAAAPSGAYYFGYDRANNKLMVFEGTAGANAEVGNGTDLQTVTGVELTIWAE